VADFDGDGWPDIFVGNEMDYWGHYYDTSYVFWNSAQGFDWANPVKLRSNGANDGVWTDLGNIYERKPVERCISSVFHARAIAVIDSVRWWGNLPRGMSLRFWIRSGDNEKWGPWVSLDDFFPPRGMEPDCRMQYGFTVETDYKNMSLFRLDSVKIFFRPTTLSERRPLEPSLLKAGKWIFYSSPGQATLSVYDPAGNLVARRELLSADNSRIRLEFKKGVYIMELRSGDERVRVKAIF